jgi:hypothetical protein
VASLVGHDPTNSRVFGMHQDGNTFMVSEDEGLTWSAVHQNAVTDAQGAVDFVPAIDVPWTDYNTLAQGDPATAKIIGTWGGEFTLD